MSEPLSLRVTMAKRRPRRAQSARRSREALPSVEALFSPYQELLSAEEWGALCEAFKRPLPATFWVHPERFSTEEVLTRFKRHGYAPTRMPWLTAGVTLPTGVSLGRRFEYRAGLIHTQEATSMLPPLALDPQPGELVLDLCAAPGGKSAQLSLMMKGQGTLIVNDLSFARLSALRATQERLGLTNMVLCAGEGERLLEGHPPCFDKVLVDAPCSCEGTIRKKGQWSFDAEREDFRAGLRATQLKLLSHALRLTKVGGRVVYSTCTLDPLENERVVHEALNNFTAAGGSAELLPLSWAELTSSPGLTEWAGERFHESMNHSARIYPHQNDTGGFFVASIEVQAQAEESLERDALIARGWRQVKDLPRPQEEELYQWSEDVFGIGPERYDGLRFVQTSRRHASALCESLLIPPTRVEVSGLPVFHTKGRLPHFTTAAALKWGHLAARQRFELQSEAEVDLFYRGELIDAQGRGVERGDVFVIYEGRALGCGFCFLDPERGEALTLSSLYPKAIQLTEGRSASERAEVGSP